MGFDLDSWSKVAQIAFGVMAIVATVFGVVMTMRLSAQSAAAQAAAAEATAKDAKLIALGAEKSVRDVADELSKFREAAAKEFVTVEALGRIEGRIEEVGREMRSGIDDIRNRMMEFFSRPPQRPRSGS